MKRLAAGGRLGPTAQRFKARVSNPGLKSYLDLTMPLPSSTPESGSSFQMDILNIGPTPNLHPVAVGSCAAVPPQQNPESTKCEPYFLHRRCAAVPLRRCAAAALLRCRAAVLLPLHRGCGSAAVRRSSRDAISTLHSAAPRISRSQRSAVRPRQACK